MTGTPAPEQRHAIIVGAGFAGLYLLYSLRRIGLSALVLEAGADIGGTWYWNRYPGARCDVPSLVYSYSFSPELQQDWDWSERFAAQPEIESYIHHVADRFDLRSDIRTNTTVTAATHDSDANLWRVTAADGAEFLSVYLLLAVGAYSEPVVPAIRGLERFGGDVRYTSRWPAPPLDTAGRRVGIIGTGSSGMQTATALATSAPERLYVFQRTANFAVPGHNQPLTPDYLADYRTHYGDYREQLRTGGSGTDLRSGATATVEMGSEMFESAFAASLAKGGFAILEDFPDIVTDEAANQRVAERLREEIRARVLDPRIAEALCPRGHFLGSRRIMVENGYYEIFNQDNVTLVDLNADPLVAVDERGIRTARDHFELDSLLLATGFDSGTGALLRIDVRGAEGKRLAESWAAGPRSYLGLAVSGFPNMFYVAGPGSPSIRSQMLNSIEQHVEWITDLVAFMRRAGWRTVEPTPQAESAWTTHVADVVNSTLLARDDTQYIGANVPGKPRVYTSYVGGVGRYRRVCDDIAADRYRGFLITDGQRELANDRSWSPAGGGDSAAFSGVI